MIVINDEFSIQNNPYGWTLNQYYMSKPKKEGGSAQEDSQADLPCHAEAGMLCFD